MPKQATLDDTYTDTSFSNSLLITNFHQIAQPSVKYIAFELSSLTYDSLYPCNNSQVSYASLCHLTTSHFNSTAPVIQMGSFIHNRIFFRRACTQHLHSLSIQNQACRTLAPILSYIYKASQRDNFQALYPVLPARL